VDSCLVLSSPEDHDAVDLVESGRTSRSTNRQRPSSQAAGCADDHADRLDLWCRKLRRLRRFARDREALFREFLELPDGLLSHDTFSRLFRLLDPVAFATCFASFLDDLGQDGTGVVAIDGKTMRRSFDRAAGKSALHVVTAFAADTRMTIGQVATGDKESEIIAARSLLGPIDLTGALVTGDALHCQGETARLIIRSRRRLAVHAGGEPSCATRRSPRLVCRSDQRTK
jgi:hypothetical protein